MFGLFGGPSVTGINLTSILVATVGAIIVLFVWPAIALAVIAYLVWSWRAGNL